MSKFAYLNKKNDVVATSLVPREINEPKLVELGVVERIDEAPDEVTYKGEFTSNTYHRLATGNGTDIGDYEVVENVDEVKRRRYIEIDARSRELIAEGFLHQGKIFSLSRQGQSNLLGVRTAIGDHRAAGTLATFEAAFFPVTFNTLDDTDSLTIEDSDGFMAFYDDAMNTVRGHLDGGTVLKDQIRAAGTIVEIDAIVDER